MRHCRRRSARLARRSMRQSKRLRA
jgi:hypothetical protein